MLPCLGDRDNASDLGGEVEMKLLKRVAVVVGPIVALLIAGVADYKIG